MEKINRVDHSREWMVEFFVRLMSYIQGGDNKRLLKQLCRRSFFSGLNIFGQEDDPCESVVRRLKDKDRATWAEFLCELADTGSSATYADFKRISPFSDCLLLGGVWESSAPQRLEVNEEELDFLVRHKEDFCAFVPQTKAGVFFIIPMIKKNNP